MARKTRTRRHRVRSTKTRRIRHYRQKGRGYLGVPDVRSVPAASIVPVAVGDLQDGSKAFSLLSDDEKHVVDEEELYV